MVPLIDTHQHLIYPDRFDYPWIGGVPALQKSFTLEDYQKLTEEAGIEASLFMEVDVAETDSGKEALYFMEQAETGSFSLCGVIAAGRPEHEDFPAYLDSIASPRLKGIRRVLHTVDDSVSQGSTFRDHVASLADFGLPFDLCLLPRQHAVGLELVDACSGTQFVLDHCGNPNLSEPSGFDDWKKTLLQLAERDNVSAKLSGIAASGKPGSVTIGTVRPYLDTTLEAFGPDRLVWGSDWPVCTLTTKLPVWISLFREWLGTLSDTEQKKIGRINAHSLYHLS